MSKRRVISAILTLKDKNFSSGVKKATENMTDFDRKIQHVGNQISSFKKNAVNNFKSIMVGTTALSGTALAGVGVAVASTVVEMDTAFSRLEAKTGVTGSKLKELQGVAKDVFKQGFGESITTVGDDVARLQSMFNDLNSNEISKLATGAYTVSELWGSEVSEVGKTIKGMTNNFKGLSENKALDLMTFAFQKTGDYSNDLLETFDEYSMHFSKLGLSAEEFTGILIRGAENGAFNMNMVGDAAKELGIRVIDGSKTTAEGFKAIGFNADEMAAKFGQGEEVAQNAFQATIAGLAAIKDPVKRNTAGVNLFGTKWEDVRDNVILAMADSKKAVEGFEGSTDRASKAMHDNFGSKMKSVWRDLKVSIGDAFSDNGGKELMDGVASAAQKAVPKVKAMIQKGIEFGNTIKDNWGTIKPILETAGIAVGVFVVTLGAMKAIQGVSALITGFRTAMALATTGQWLMNTAMLASPLTWVAVGIAAVVTAGVLLYKNWDTVKEKAGLLWDKVKEVGGGIKDAFVSAWDAVQSAAGTAVNFVIDKINGVVETINKIPGVNIPIVPKVEWGDNQSKIEQAASSGTKSTAGVAVEGSFAVGTNRVKKDMVAQIHKDEMIIPAVQARYLRGQGATINNITKINKPLSESGGNEIIIPARNTAKLRSEGTTINNITNKKEFAPKLSPNPPSKNGNDGGNIINLNVTVNAKGITAQEVANEFVPLVKARLENM